MNVKELVAKRAGFCCSHPECHRPTVGPQVAPEGVTNIGVAAHICGASPGGKRYDPNQSTEERESSSNAIWLCQNHAKLIDSDEVKYTVELLRSWRERHEVWQANRVGQASESAITEVSGLHSASGLGNVTGLDIRGPAIIKPGTISRAEGWGNVTGTRIGK